MQSNTIMKFITGKHVPVSGTSFRASVTVPYSKLVRILGEPTYEHGDKTLADWSIQFEDGTIATIYDWKNYGKKKEHIKIWHIGGFSNRATELVLEMLEQ